VEEVRTSFHAFLLQGGYPRAIHWTKTAKAAPQTRAKKTKNISGNLMMLDKKLSNRRKGLASEKEVGMKSGLLKWNANNSSNKNN